MTEGETAVLTDERESEPIPLSALQHAVYCLRQAALIHLERLWAENRFTAQGQALHQAADKPGQRKVRGVRRVAALPLASKKLGIAGVADLVEFHGEEQIPYPIEIKRGKPKLHRADEVQLCAQALCLEEMTGRAVPEGALYYAETKRRVTVPFDEDLRRLTEETVAELREIFRTLITPPPTYRANRCRSCSLIELCRPKASAKPARTWRDKMVEANLADGGESRLKKLLNTIYITTEGAALRKDGENLVAEIEDVEKARVPFHMLASVVTFGAIHLSPPLIQACAAAGITIVLLDRVGRFQARVEGPVAGNVLLRRAQYRSSDAPDEIVRSLVTGKISNQRAVLMRALRDYGSEFPSEARVAIEAVVERMARILRRVGLGNEPAEFLRGAEGEAANLYFSVFGHLIRSPDAALRFNGRSRRPPLDPVNALLSFLYTLLTHDCRSATESVGLDPAVGFLHRDRPGRPSLALDLMEELRPILADRLALSLINRRQLREKDFEFRDGGAVFLNEEGRRTVLTAWQERKKEERRHPFIEETAPLGLIPFLQAQLLARHLRGDLDAYPPWFWK